MAAKIKTLFDKLGNKLYPKTKTSAVYDDNNVTLNVSLNNYAHFIDEQSITPISNPNLYRSDIDTSALSESDVKVPSSNLVKTKIENVVKFRSPTSITTETNPIIRKSDLVQSLSTSQDVPPSSNAVKTVTDTISNLLTQQVGSVTPQSGFIIASALHRKVSHICELDVIFYPVTVGSGWINAWVYCGDVSILPETNINFTWYNGSTGTIFCEGYVDTAGKVYFRPEEEVTSIYLNAHVMYITAN